MPLESLRIHFNHKILKRPAGQIEFQTNLQNLSGTHLRYPLLNRKIINNQAEKVLTLNKLQINTKFNLKSNQLLKNVM